VECKRELTEQKEHNRNNTKERMTHDGPFILLFLFGSFRASFVPHSITNEPNRKGNERGPWVRNEENSEFVSFVSFTFVFLQMKCVKKTKEKNKSTNSTPSFPFLLVQFNYNEVREEKEAWIKLNKKRKKGNEVVSLFFVLCSIIEVERERALHLPLFPFN